MWSCGERLHTSTEPQPSSTHSHTLTRAWIFLRLPVAALLFRQRANTLSPADIAARRAELESRFRPGHRQQADAGEPLLRGFVSTGISIHVDVIVFPLDCPSCHVWG